MKDLKIGMPIFATSTTFLTDNTICMIHGTTLADAFTSTNQKSLQVRLGDGNWGACPTRNREQVCINKSEVKELLTNLLVELFNNTVKDLIYTVELNHVRLTISTLRKNREVNSLVDGSYTEYRGGYTTMRVYNNLPKNAFHSLEEAIQFASELSEKHFDK